MQKVTFEWLSMLIKAEIGGRPFSPPFSLDYSQSSAFFRPPPPLFVFVPLLFALTFFVPVPV
jgi:hypothetical protein